MRNAICFILVSIALCSSVVYSSTEIKKLKNEVREVKAIANDATLVRVPDWFSNSGVSEYRVIAMSEVPFGAGVTASIPLYVDEKNYKMIANVIRVSSVQKSD